jgi:hypothetical protein
MVFGVGQLVLRVHFMRLFDRSRNLLSFNGVLLNAQISESYLYVLVKF